jgi:hypothetical protein
MVDQKCENNISGSPSWVEVWARQRQKKSDDIFWVVE